MPLVHILTPFSRPENFTLLQEDFRQADSWTRIVTAPQYEAFKSAISAPFDVVDKEIPAGRDICYAKMNAWLERNRRAIHDDDYYMFMCDDDALTENLVRDIKKQSHEILVLSCKRGDSLPLIGNTFPLIASPDRMQVCLCTWEQVVVKGRILKQIRFNDESNTADGEMMEWLKRNFGEKIKYLPDLFVKFNFLQPGRWHDAPEIPQKAASGAAKVPSADKPAAAPAGGGLSFVTLLSYDYRYVYECISSYYDVAEEIVLGLDSSRLTWSGRTFDIDMEALRAFIRRTDVHHKIRIVEANFHKFKRPMENDTYERNYLDGECKKGNWVLQIDADERLMNAGELVEWIKSADPASGFWATWLSVFKVFGDKIVVVDAEESTPIGYKVRGMHSRARALRLPKAPSPLRLLHYSWGRSETELAQKLDNWSHAEDFDTKKFLELWKSVTPENCGSYKNLHPLGDGSLWPALKLVELGA